MHMKPNRSDLGEWAKLSAFERERGVSAKTVRNKIHTGEWPEGIMVKKCGKFWYVNLRAFDYLIQHDEIPKAA